MQLNGKRIVISGAATGIGRACALVMAELGADLGLFDRAPAVENTAAQARESGRNVVSLVGDVRSVEEVSAAVGAIAAQIGPIDGLVNMAAVVSSAALMSEMTQSRWQLELDVNLTGSFNMIRAVIDGMTERGFGRIVNVASVGARGGNFGKAAYAASKSGLIGLTQTVTLEYAGRGITCNAVLPGLIGTPKVVETIPQASIEATLSQTPALRLGEPREVAHLIAFLCSDEAGYINGAEIPIDGGYSLNTATVRASRAPNARSL